MNKLAHEEVLEALADPTRRAIFEDLCWNGEKTVIGLTVAAGIAQPGVSVHLRKLKQAGLVSNRPKGRETYYSADQTALEPLLTWLRKIASHHRKRRASSQTYHGQ